MTADLAAGQPLQRDEARRLRQDVHREAAQRDDVADLVIREDIGDVLEVFLDR